MKGFRQKILRYEYLAEWRAGLPASSRPLVVTNGCFDLFHPGHLFFLEEARRQGETLLIGVNTDESIRSLKGQGRPIVSESDRVYVLAALEPVSAVCVFPEIDAREFIIRSQPDVYFKGGTYTLDTINQSERKLLESLNVRTLLSSQFGTYSTTNLVARCSFTAKNLPKGERFSELDS